MREPKVKLVEDGWVNPGTGMGTLRDKSVQGYFSPEALLQSPELSALYYNNDLAATIVEAKVEESFREGYTLQGEESEELGELQKEAQETLHLDEKLQQAWTWGRLYGGCLAILGVNDGQDMAKPVNEKRIKSIDYVNVVDRRYARVESYYSDPLKPNYGQPQIYAIHKQTMASGPDVSGVLIPRVHESRVLRFDGSPVDQEMLHALAGWSMSVLQRPYDTLRKFGTTFDAMGILVQEASQGIFKMKNLVKMIGSNEKDKLMQRMSLVDQSKSVARSILVDADGEDYTRIAVNFAGLPEMADRFIKRLAGAARMPVTVLMGDSPSGLNATGKSDLDLWYNQIKKEQTKVLEPKLLKVYRYLAGPEKELMIAWRPLAQTSEAEHAAVYQQTANADKTYVDMGAIQPEEIAIARWGAGKYDALAPINIDVAKLEASLHAVTEFAPPSDFEPAEPAQQAQEQGQSQDGPETETAEPEAGPPSESSGR